jgi:hypothetical protein
MAVQGLQVPVEVQVQAVLLVKTVPVGHLELMVPQDLLVHQVKQDQVVLAEILVHLVPVETQDHLVLRAIMEAVVQVE